ncbi:unnamed protein product [Penicillium glandicola]
MISQAHSITVADIETYNARTWAWPGCGHIPQGAFICLSAGEPPMPVALPNAVCGPQVPGTTRPNSWSELGSLNPCAANECCSSFGLCETTSDFCTSATYATTALSNTHPTESKTTSTSTTKSIQKLVASSEPSPISKTTLTSTTKSVPAPASTTTTTKTTTPTKTTSTKTTTSSQTKAKTSTSKAPTVSPWTLTMYSKVDCVGNYYVLEGHNEGYSTQCVNLHSGLSSKYTDTGVFCKWFTDGGNSYNDCDAGNLHSPQSWIMQGGLCTTYNRKDCNGTDLDFYTYTSKETCHNRGKFDTPNFVSMNCYI